MNDVTHELHFIGEDNTAYETRSPCIPDYVIHVWDKLSQETRNDYLKTQVVHHEVESCPDSSHDVFEKSLTPADKARQEILYREWYRDTMNDLDEVAIAEAAWEDPGHSLKDAALDQIGLLMMSRGITKEEATVVFLDDVAQQREYQEQVSDANHRYYEGRYTNVHAVEQAQSQDRGGMSF
jgi:hypothetical protein